MKIGFLVQKTPRKRLLRRPENVGLAISLRRFLIIISAKRTESKSTINTVLDNYRRLNVSDRIKNIHTFIPCVFRLSLHGTLINFRLQKSLLHKWNKEKLFFFPQHV